MAIQRTAGSQPQRRAAVIGPDDRRAARDARIVMPEEHRLLRRNVLLSVLVLVCRRLVVLVEFDEPREVARIAEITDAEQHEDADHQPDECDHTT